MPTGDSCGNPDKAGAGGVLSEMSNGRWFGGFAAHNVGIASATVAGLWGSFHWTYACKGSWLP